ncbi:FAD linked oxidase domain protein [Acidothermus cellulolyticus 11B]|uniref:FAD linked oxidase domain protein n=1 Tax=Acidothermus cellulolyticus (strain ATCC 43068 / DSM 8971 / 11B) TaxID=351607 RepID=A0LUY2_ACIC1|nr:FAD linked oxidase domain protein [Acidothermus cellulolyticus 11B]
MSGRFAASTGSPEHRDLIRALRSVMRGPVDASSRRRAEYSSDASNYRVVPAVVAYPQDASDVCAAIDVARRFHIPVTMRGGGTSVAGNAIGPGIVLDTSRFFRRILDIDPSGRTAYVEPGVILADLQKALRPHGLRFGPDPATANRATIGGALGNNACGSHALAFGRAADNVIEMDVVDGTGRRFTVGSGWEPVPGLARLVEENAAIIRTEFGRFSRQISGYGMEHLLPEKGRFLARALVGSEGSAVLVLGARVRVVDIPRHTALAVLGFPDLIAAADAVPIVLRHAPLAVEGLAARLVDVIRRAGRPVPTLPDGGGWLLVEVGGASDDHAVSRARRVVADVRPMSSAVLTDSAQAAAIWRIREDGAGLVGRFARSGGAWPGWEDAAVPPENLGPYLRDFTRLLDEFGIDAIPFGHFGDGCVHTRLDVPLTTAGDVERFRSFIDEAADIVCAYGGSFSGEHGDGRARSRLLPRMYSAQAMRLFADFKRLFDPEGILNPGIIVHPPPLDADLRRPLAADIAAATGFRFTADAGSFTRAVHRCVGIGKCRADYRDSGTFMCPSYLATRDEKDTTRGRARVLQELAVAARGGRRAVARSFRTGDVHDALDLCLSCKACASDCPTGVDMARYKSEVLYRAYRWRLRPRSHYTLGRLPSWLRLVRGMPALSRRLLRAEPAVALLRFLAGIDPHRSLPLPARRGFRPGDVRPWLDDSGDPAGSGEAGTAVLWVDSFTQTFAPHVAAAAAWLLTTAGYRVRLPDRQPCCGLPWITTGQLRAARRRLAGLVDVLHPAAAEGAIIVGIEPSCTATLRSDLPDLLADPRAEQIAHATRTLAEALLAARWQPPQLDGVHLLVQPHCHHYAVIGYDADRALLGQTGAQLTEAAGCCGMAGNFGMEKRHYAVSRRIAELGVLALLANRPDSVVVADGFSCRTQLADLADCHAVHLAELLAGAAGTADGAARTEDSAAGTADGGAAGTADSAAAGGAADLDAGADGGPAPR